MAVKTTIDVLTIGEPGDTPDGYAMIGIHTIEAAKTAVEGYDGGPETGWPHHTVIEVLPAFLHCWACGRGWGSRHARHCDGDEEGYVWNFRSGETHTILMRDGRSIYDCLPSLLGPKPEYPPG